MYFDIFGEIRKNLDKKSKLSRPNLLNINPSSQVCYSPDGKQIGSCLRQVWLDKTGHPKNNTVSLKAKMAAFSGNWWEDWFVEQLRYAGVFEGTQITASDPARLVKGLVDVSIINPLTNKLELIELKTYDGSNYTVSQAILGNKTNKPKPNMKHLLQAFRYLLIYQGEVDCINLCYLDRACGDWYKYKQFRIELIEINEVLYPNIITTWNNEYCTYILEEVTDTGLYLAEDTLLEKLHTNIIPTKEFIEEFSKEEINEKFLDGEIPKYVYDKWLKDPDNNPIGDFQCKYCPFSGGTCKSYD